MKIELKKKLEQIIAAYQENTTQYIAELKNVIDEWKDQVNAYKPEHIHHQISTSFADISSNYRKTNKVFNQKLKNIADEAKKQVFAEYLEPVKKSADYATKINNALQFLMIEGDGITDDTAYMILKDFVNDFDQMKLFKKVIEKRVLSMEDADGNPVFPKTFGKLHEVEVILNSFDELKLASEKIFLYDKQDDQLYIINGTAYALPKEKGIELEAEDIVLNNAETIDKKLEEIPGIDQVTDQTEHETIEN